MSKKATQLNPEQKFNRLTAKTMLPRLPEHKGHIMWEFLCDCGKPVIAAASRVISGRLKSCGCFQRDYQASGARIKDMVGLVFGRYTVKYFDKIVNRTAYWICVCECGTEKSVAGSHLRHGKTVSCGCYQKESAGNHCRDNYTTHGMTRTITGASWTAMFQRCYNKNTKAYPDYGARGIKPCAFIKESPLNLVSVIGERPSKDLSLDRINNALGYFCGQCDECKLNAWPLNLRWATRLTQNRNRRMANLFSIDGIRKSIGEWAELWNVPYTTARYRIWLAQRQLDETVIDYAI